MRNTTTLTVALLGLLLVAGSVQAQPAPFPPTTVLTVTYPNTPSASGEYTFAFDASQFRYIHDGLPGSFGMIEWDGPFTPQTVSGQFVHADDRFLINFRGRWWPDGTFLILSAPHPTATVVGTSIPEPSSLSLLLPLAGVAARRRR